MWLPKSRRSWRFGRERKSLGLPVRNGNPRPWCEQALDYVGVADMGIGLAMAGKEKSMILDYARPRNRR